MPYRAVLPGIFKIPRNDALTKADQIAGQCPLDSDVLVVKQPGVEVSWVRAVLGLDQERLGSAQVIVWDRDIHRVLSMSTRINSLGDFERIERFRATC
jgi:hypothetical protein